MKNKQKALKLSHFHTFILIHHSTAVILCGKKKL